MSLLSNCDDVGSDDNKHSSSISNIAINNNIDTNISDKLHVDPSLIKFTQLLQQGFEIFVNCNNQWRIMILWVTHNKHGNKLLCFNKKKLLTKSSSAKYNIEFQDIGYIINTSDIVEITSHQTCMKKFDIFLKFPSICGANIFSEKLTKILDSMGISIKTTY